VVFKFQYNDNLLQIDKKKIVKYIKIHNHSDVKLSVLENDSFVHIKSIFDFFVSLILLIFLSPIFLFTSILIKIDSKGPVFYSQERIGKNGRTFRIIKFRSMKTNLSKDIILKNEADGPVFKMKNDPRITRVGKIIRKYGIDELPQLLNVINGDMSIIGPRPPLKSEVELYENRSYLKRLSVKPGITGPWQVHPLKHDISFDKLVRLDLDYINEWSFKKDLMVIFQTIRYLFNPSSY